MTQYRRSGLNVPETNATPRKYPTLLERKLKSLPLAPRRALERVASISDTITWMTTRSYPRIRKMSYETRGPNRDMARAKVKSIMRLERNNE
jgi:hypothetical protein